MTPRPLLLPPATTARFYGMGTREFAASTVMPVRSTFDLTLDPLAALSDVSSVVSCLSVYRDGANSGRHTPSTGGVSDALVLNLLTFLGKAGRT